MRLKQEEMLFKFKARVGALLKEMSLPVVQLNHFSTLGKID